jgi:aminoglycoside phosphotransferase (APT) family kinase protein
MVEINVELVKKLINNQFPQWSGLPIIPVIKGGNDNRTFHLGNKMSVRLPSKEHYEPQIEKEIFWLLKLKKHLKLPISEPIAKGKPDEGYPWVWSVCRWIDGYSSNSIDIQDMSRFAKDLV